MGLLSTLEARSRDSWSMSDPRWYGPVPLRKTASGASVTPDGALGITAVWNAVTMIAGTVGTLPIKLYRRRSDGGKEVAREHPVHRVLSQRPNPWQAPVTFVENAQGHALLRGNAYAEIVRNGRGKVSRLTPLHPGRMHVEARSDHLFYQYTNTNGRQIEYRNPGPSGLMEVLHVPGLGDGVVGHSPVSLMRETLGLAAAAEEFGARFFSNDATPGGLLRTAGTLSESASKRIRESWKAAQTGDKRHSVAVLEEGLEWQSVGLNAEDAQFIATRKFQIEEIARMFNIPPHLIKHLERSTFNNIEHQGIEFHTHTIRPWLVRWEQAIEGALLSEAEREQYFVKFNADAILRGDNASRSAFYREMFGIGGFSINDILSLEDMNPVEGGDQRFVPLNMIPLDRAADFAEPAGTGGSDEGRGADTPVETREGRQIREQRSLRSRRRTEHAYRRLFTDAASRVVKREVNEVRRAIAKHLGARSISSLVEWLESFYAQHGAYARDAILPVLMSYSEEVQSIAAEEIGSEAVITESMQRFTEQYATTFSDRFTRSSLRQLTEIIAESSADDLEDALYVRLDEWEETRAEKTGTREARQSGEALVFAAYGAFGVRRVRSVTFGKNCPFCNSLDGKVIDVAGGAFIHANEQITVAGKSLPAFKDIRHPPYHDGCDCSIVAA